MEDQFDSGGFGADSASTSVRKSHNWSGGVRKHVSVLPEPLTSLDYSSQQAAEPEPVVEPAPENTEISVTPDTPPVEQRKDFTSASKPQHCVWIYVPHSGAELILDGVIEATKPDLLSDNVHCFAEYSSWVAQGGQLLVNLSELNTQTNSLLVHACSIGLVKYLAEPDLTLWRYIALLELCSGRSVKQLPSVVTVPNQELVETVHIHSHMWWEIISQWQRVFPGQTVNISAEYDATITAPYTVNWSDEVLTEMEPLEKPTKIRILDDLCRSRHRPRCGMDARDMIYFLNKMPLHNEK